MRPVLGYAAALGVVMTIVSLPLSALIVLRADRAWAVTTAELFTPEARSGDGLVGLLWGLVAALVVALLVTARNATAGDRPASGVVIATYLLAALTAGLLLVLLVATARVADDLNGIVGAGPGLFIVGGASIAFACAASTAGTRRDHVTAETEVA
jgi:hypothetical protein